MIAVGIDLSLTSTGIARIESDDPIPWLATVTSNGTHDATLLERAERIEELTERIVHVVTNDGLPSLVVVEGPSYGQHRQSGQHDRAGLWWSVASALTRRGVALVEVAPAARMKYATGVGNAKKDAVLAATIRRYRTAVITGNDEADALILAAMGARALGGPVETSLPERNRAAMDKVRWGEVLEA